jgi:hypothetical protein
MKRKKAPNWSAAETDLIFRGSEDGKTDAEIAEIINNIHGTNRTANACYRRAVQLRLKVVCTSRSPRNIERERFCRQRARDRLKAAKDEQEEVSQNDIAKSQDAAFQAAMLNASRGLRGPSSAAGTDAAKPIAMTDKRMIHRFHAALGGSATAKRGRPQPHFPRRWTPEETMRAAAMHAEGASYREIGERMRRSEGSVMSHLKEPGLGKVHDAGWHAFAKPTEDMMVAMEARRDAFDARDLTATMCGDPPVGYRALDKRGVIE